MLPGRFFLLILLYLPAKDVLFGKGNVQWDSSLSKYNVLSHRLLLPPKTFFNIGLAISPGNGAAADARSPIGKPVPLCFLYFFLPFFYYHQCTKHLLLQIVSLLFQLIFISLIDCICSVFKVSPFLVKIYRYSPSE